MSFPRDYLNDVEVVVDGVNYRVWFEPDKDRGFDRNTCLRTPDCLVYEITDSEHATLVPLKTRLAKRIVKTASPLIARHPMIALEWSLEYTEYLKRLENYLKEMDVFENSREECWQRGDVLIEALRR